MTSPACSIEMPGLVRVRRAAMLRLVVRGVGANGGAALRAIARDELRADDDHERADLGDVGEVAVALSDRAFLVEADKALLEIGARGLGDGLRNRRGRRDGHS